MGQPACGTNGQRRKKAGELQCPDAEVSCGAPRGSAYSGMHVIEDGRYKPEIFLTRLRGWQQLFGNFRYVVKRTSKREVANECKLRLHKIARVYIDQFT